MAQTTAKIEKALKLKAKPSKNALFVKLGTKKLVLPFEVRLLQSEAGFFVHIPPSAGLFKADGKACTRVTSDADAAELQKSFREKKKTTRTRKAAAAPVTLHPELEAALAKLPPGMKLIADSKGTRLVKMRTRTKK